MFNCRPLSSAHTLHIVVVLLFLGVSSSDAVNGVSTSILNKKQPPPFSPSLEHLIHSNVSGFRNIDNKGSENSNDVSKPRLSKVSDFPELGLDRSVPTKSYSPALDQQGKTTRTTSSFTLSQQVDNFSRSSNLTSSRSTNSATLNRVQSPNPPRVGFLFEAGEYPPFDRECPPELSSGHLRWRKDSRIITATLPHFVSRAQFLSYHVNDILLNSIIRHTLQEYIHF